MLEESASKKTLNIFVLVDSSGSMTGQKIQSLNAAMEEAIPELQDTQDSNPFAEMMVQVIDFSTGAQWQNVDKTPVVDFTWTSLEASGVTDLGAGIELLTEALTPEKMGRRCLPPLVILLSDGAPTDDWESKLETMNSAGWGKRNRTTRIAIAIGQDADKEVLAKFTGNIETVLPANNVQQLTALIKWATVTLSTHSSKQASQVDTHSADNGDAAEAAPVLPPPPVVTSDDADDDVW